MAENEGKTLSTNDSQLREIRENFEYASSAWRKPYEEFDTDMRFLTRGPWSDKDLAARKQADRPALVTDELTQYLNQYVNDVRQNPRSIKLVPDGEGASDELAELKQGIIRRAEEKSNARYARLTAAEHAAIGGFGFYGLVNRYLDNHTNDQELAYRTFPNPKAVLIDPDFLQPDASDSNYAFVVKAVRKVDFKRKYSKATVTDFIAEHALLAPKWIKQDTIQVAEYWKVKKTFKTESIDGKEREVEKREVWQYITNGLEILDAIQWSKEITHQNGKEQTHGIYIPIIPVFAKVLWTDGPAGPERVFISMVRMARDPYMLYCACRTNQAEFCSMLPKVHAVAYKGQINGQDLIDWTNSHKSPVGVLFAEATIDGTGQALLPLPTRMQYDASPVAVMDAAAESFRRAIQSAMGASPLPTAAQRRNEKSGIALERIEASQQRGWFHLSDNLDMAINHEGRVFNDYMPVIYDTARELGIKKDDDTYALAKVNQSFEDKGQQQAALMLTDGGHDVTIATGPSYESQREEQTAFLDLLITQLPNLGLPPEVMGKMLSLAIRMKHLGSLGDKMADILSPDEKDEMPPQAKQAIQQMQQQLQSVDAFAKEMQAMVQKLTQEKAAKSMELDSKERVAAMNNQTQLVLQQMQVSGDALIERLSAEFGALTGRLTAQQAEVEPENEFAEAGQ